MTTESLRIDDAAFNKANEADRRLLARGPLATAACYAAGRVHVELNNGCAFEFPVAHAQGLASSAAERSSLMEDHAQVQALKLQALRATIDAGAVLTPCVRNILAELNPNKDGNAL